MGELSKWRSSDILGDLYGISSGYPRRSILDIKWGITRRGTVDLFRLSLEIIRISWETSIGYCMGYLLKKLRRSD